MDYHDYIFRDGKFIGAFDDMYNDVGDPWIQTEQDFENIATTSRLVFWLKKEKIRSAHSLGCGTGLHLNWLSKQCERVSFSGSDISSAAITQAQSNFTHIPFNQGSLSNFAEEPSDSEAIIVREVLWYAEPEWQNFVTLARKNLVDRYLALEVSTYENQRYATDLYDGAKDLISRFPFTVIEAVRWNPSGSVNAGMVFIWSRIEDGEK